MHATNDQSPDKLNNIWKIEWPIYFDFSYFTTIILPSWRDNFKFNNGGGLLSSVF